MQQHKVVVQKTHAGIHSSITIDLPFLRTHVNVLAMCPPPAPRHKLDNAQSVCRETPSILLKSSFFGPSLSSASNLPLLHPLQYVKLAIPAIPSSNANLHHLSFFHQSHLGHASSILAPGYTFPLPGSEKTVSVPRRRLHRRDFSNPGT